MKRIRLSIVLLALAGLALSACTYVEVANTANETALVKVNMPDGSAPVRFIDAGSSTSFMTAQGGRYTLAVLPNQQYVEMLNGLKAMIAFQLFSTTPPTEAGLMDLMDQIISLDEQIRKELETKASCGNRVADFSIAQAGVALNGDTWSATCGEGKAEETTE